MNKLNGVTVIDFFAEVIDIYIDDIGAGIKIETPDFFGELRAAQQDCGISEEELKKRVFAGGEFYLGCTSRGLVGDGIQL